MVKSGRFSLQFLVLCTACIIFGCKVDLPGLFVSSDLNERLKERNTFNYLTESDMTLSLGNEYSFIVLGDIHINDRNARGLEKLQTIIENSGGKIKFVVLLGDITENGSARDIDRFIEIADSFRVPCYPVIGNHDVYFGHWSIWKEKIGSTNYRIDDDNAALFILDSASAFLGKDQMDWLERELENTQGRVFVFSHANLFVEAPIDIQQFTDTKERNRILSLLKNKCDAMFMGHVHRRIIKEVGNVQYITMEDYRGKKAYCLVSVDEHGVNYQFMKL